MADPVAFPYTRLVVNDIPHQRRVRYSGTHPRRFAEKYKEHDPVRYAEEVRKIMERGKTPAGMHRSILVREVLEVLRPQPGEIAVDATLGYGGHAQELLRAVLPGGRLLALDVDPLELPRTEARLRALEFPPESLLVRRSNFAGLAQALAAENLAGADVILADLGLSSMQIDNPERGFSFKVAGPLDLRLNPERGRPGLAWLATLDEAALVRALEDNADEPHARVIASAVCEARQNAPINTTTEFATVIRRALGPGSGPRAKENLDLSIRRSFQALRILVNDEFGALDAFLRLLPGCLRPGGRVAILSFHSGEDRRVKKAFQTGERDGTYAQVAPELIRPGPEETRANPRASSAKLRWAVRA